MVAGAHQHLGLFQRGGGAAEDAADAQAQRLDPPQRTLGFGLVVEPVLQCGGEFGVGHALHRRLGDVATVDVLFRRIVYFFRPDAVRQILVDHGDSFEREARLLYTVSQMLEKRFAQALKKHIQQLSNLQAEPTAEGAEAPSANAVSPLPWLLPLRQAMRSALQAELDTRLQPVLGLVEAFNAYQPKEQ